MADTKTRTDLINEVAALLGRLVPGEALDFPASDSIDGCIDPAVAEPNRIVVIDADGIQTVYFNTLARIVAVHAAAKFANAPLDMEAVKVLEQRMYVLAAGDPGYTPAVYEYF